MLLISCSIWAGVPFIALGFVIPYFWWWIDATYTKARKRDRRARAANP